MKILADSSAWIRHFREGLELIEEPIRAKNLLITESIIGELAMGSLKNRLQTLGDLKLLPKAKEPSFEENLLFIEKHKLYARGLSYIDCTILAAALMADAKLLSFDRLLMKEAQRFSIAYN